MHSNFPRSRRVDRKIHETLDRLDRIDEADRQDDLSWRWAVRAIALIGLCVVMALMFGWLQ